MSEPGGNIDRQLSDAETTAAASVVAYTVRALSAHPEEVTIYAIACVVEAIAHSRPDKREALRVIVGKIADALACRVS